MFTTRTAIKCLFASATVLSLTACAPSAYTVKEPTPSSQRYQNANTTATTIGQTDGRAGDEKIFSNGTLPATLKIGKQAIDPPAFLATQVSAELASRGLPVQVVNGSNGIPQASLHTFRIQNHRASGFSPFVTLTFISAELDTGTEKKRIGVFVKRGKVPVWSFDEVVEPTFSQPLSLAVKEYSSKIANALYNYRSADSEVDALVAKLSGTLDDNSFLDVYALGFTNNPKAINTVAELTKSPNEYVRLAAISALGNLRASTQFDLLKSIYSSQTNQWSDRAMAIKSIGDLDTAQSKAFLVAEMKRWEATKSDKEAQWTTQIIGLYL